MSSHKYRATRMLISRRLLKVSALVPKVRGMAGGHAKAEVPTSGIEGFVAKYLPKNHHVRKIK